jgi:hypothetical protein
MPALAASYAATPATGGSVVPAANTTLIYLTPAGTLATLTVHLPALNDGQSVVIFSTQIITALTVAAPAGGTLTGATLKTLTANTAAAFLNSGGASGKYALQAAVLGAAVQSKPSNPTAPASVSAYTMQGLAGAITPVRSGNIAISVCFTITNTSGNAGDGIAYQLSYGTGTAPSNAATLAGTQIGTIGTYENSAALTAADVALPTCQMANVTGLTLRTPYWIDLAAESVATISVTALTAVNISAVEN